LQGCAITLARGHFTKAAFGGLTDRRNHLAVLSSLRQMYSLRDTEKTQRLSSKCPSGGLADGGTS